MNRLMARLAITVSTISVVVFWAIYLDNVRVKTERARLIGEQAQTVLLNGLAPHFDGAIPMLIESNPPPDTANAQLIFAVADSCVFSRRIVPRLVEWIANSDPTSYSVILVSFDGTEQVGRLSEALRNRGISHSGFNVVQRQRFGLASGISATPRLVGLTADGKARRIANEASPETLASFGAFLAEQGHFRPR